MDIHKRDIFIDRVKQAKASQQQSQQKFKTTYKHLSNTIGFNRGDFQPVYEQLNDDY